MRLRHQPTFRRCTWLKRKGLAFIKGTRSRTRALTGIKERCVQRTGTGGAVRKLTRYCRCCPQRAVTARLCCCTVRVTRRSKTLLRRPTSGALACQMRTRCTARYSMARQVTSLLLAWRPCIRMRMSKECVRESAISARKCNRASAPAAVPRPRCCCVGQTHYTTRIAVLASGTCRCNTHQQLQHCVVSVPVIVCDIRAVPAHDVNQQGAAGWIPRHCVPRPHLGRHLKNQS